MYMQRHGDKAIIASTYNHGGMFAEKPGGAVSCDSSCIESFGKWIKQKVKECEYKKEFDYSGAKKSDWPSFKESGLNAIRAFETGFVSYIVRGANESNIIWRIFSPALPNGVELHSTISSTEDGDEIGSWVNDFHEFFLKVESVEF